jgi:nucleoside-diphosphate-sugar epimerase
MSKVVVTGGAGFIGSHLVNSLVSKGYEVHVIDNLVSGQREYVNPAATFHFVDIRSLNQLREIIAGAKYVFHEAALPRVQFSIQHPIETNETNVVGTMNTLIASAESGVKKFIYAASSSAYGDQDVLPLSEDMIPKPKSPYGLQKYVGEQYCQIWSQVYGLPTVSLRYFNVYGPRQSAEGAYALVIAKFFKLRRDGLPMTVSGDGEQTRDFTHIRDVVNANLLAAESDKVGSGEVLNIGAGRNFSVNRVASLIGGPIVFIPPRIEPKHTLADNSKARSLLGWEPKVTLEDGIMELKSAASQIGNC